MRPASRTASRPLTSSTPMFSRPTVGRSISNSDARHGAAHHRELDEVLRIGADRGADVEHDRFAAHRRPERGDGRPLDPGAWSCRQNLRHRHQRAGVAGGDRDIGLAALAPPRARATSTTSSGHGAAPGSASRPSSRRRRCGRRGETALRRGCCASSGAIWASLPNKMNSESGCRTKDISAPGINTVGPWSPPMASMSNADLVRHQWTLTA